jgi:hypothetical protein
MVAYLNKQKMRVLIVGLKRVEEEGRINVAL